jgi:hypothetical protein
MTPGHSRALIRSLAALALALLAPAAVSAGTLDQEHVVIPNNFGAAIDAGGGRVQTFTVGQTGLLDRLELQLWRNANVTAPLSVQLRRTLPSGAPDVSASGLLVSLSLAPAAVPTTPFITTFTGLDLDRPFPVAAGDQLALHLSSTTPDGAWYLWATAEADATPPGPQYPRGQSWFQSTASGPFTASPTQDSGFRTFVAIPEPTALGIAASAALLLLRRRR